MELLKLLEGIRNPVLDFFFSTVTKLGDETVFIIIGLIFFWCIDKWQGYYLLSIGFLGTVINQFLKLLFRIPRPWVRDPDFTIVESAREAASGYSFPSGHTQASVGGFGGIARWSRQKAIRIIAIIICFLVPLSRMYLGVHTPLDVGVSIIIALALVFGLYPLCKKAKENPNIMRVILAVVFCVSLIYLLFVLFYNFPSNIDKTNYTKGVESAYKMLGCSLGILIVFELDWRFIKFETKASLKVQIIKLLTGVIPLLFIKEVLRFPLDAIFDGTFLGDGIRYFLMVVFAGAVWPLTFKRFAKLDNKKS